MRRYLMSQESFSRSFKLSKTAHYIYPSSTGYLRKYVEKYNGWARLMNPQGGDMRNCFFLLALLASDIYAANFWSEDRVTNTAIVTANAFIIADWAQTRHIADNPMSPEKYGYYEKGFAENFIGRHPTTKEVNQYFLASICLTNFTGYLLPEKATLFGVTFNPKKSFYVGVAIFEGNFIYKNSNIGVRGDF